MAEKEILKLYKPADRILTVNENDPTLIPIDIPLPKCPDIELIDGFGLKPYDQLFIRPQIPPALLKIRERNETLDKCWADLELNRRDLKAEIEWLQKQLYYRLNGYWFFNDGKPTYVTPAHYEAIAFLRTHTGLIPAFRDRSRKLQLMLKFVAENTFDFKEKNFDQAGVRLPNKRGDEMEDLGERTLMGVILAKGRRMAATYDGICWVKNRIETNKSKYSGLQAQDEAHGRKLWLKFTTVWRSSPWFFTPFFEGNDADPQSKIRYQRSSSFMNDFGLQSQIDYAKTHSCRAYDGEEMFDLLLDEKAKQEIEELYPNWDVITNTITWSEGKVINGFAFLPSTSGKMTKSGAKNFLSLIKDSNYYHRTPNGRTKSGLVAGWFSSAEGSPGFIDRHGNSQTEKANKHYMDMRTHYLHEGTPEAIEKYQEQCREHPLFFMEAFIREDGGAGFNQVILDKRIGELSYRKEPPRFDLMWSQGFGSNVIPVENPKGKFHNLKLLPAERANRKYWSNGQWYPENRLFAMHGSDTFNYSETEGRRKSLGAIIGVKRRISYLEDQNEDIKNWKTPDCIYTYANRTPTVEDYAEDCLKACIYFGGLMNPESNNPHVRQYFKRHNFAGYLYYYKRDDSTYFDTPGYTKSTNTGNIHMTHATKYIEKHGHRCDHIELLKQCKEFTGVEDLTNLDLLSAFGAALDAIDNDFRSDEVNQFQGGITYRELFGHR